MLLKALIIFTIFSTASRFLFASQILIIIPYGAKSHFIFFEPFIYELAKRGHNLTVVSPFPQKHPVSGITDINTKGYGDLFANNMVLQRPTEYFKAIRSVFNFNRYISISAKLFDSPKIKRLLNSTDERFDLVITELFDTDLWLVFANKFNAPNIAISSCPLLPWANARFGNPDNPSYIPLSMSNYTNQMGFIQRVFNAGMWASTKLLYEIVLLRTSTSIGERYFGENLPSLSDLSRQTSLMFVNSHYSLHGVRPFATNVVEVGGIHVTPVKELPKDLEKFINESEHGVVYFCMGSMLKASTLPDDKRDALIDVFSKLPQRVLWKWENETMPGKPDNVKLVKWMPQRDVLAHPNIRLFISHGGLLGTTEAVHSGVPILGMPFYGDQGVNIAAVVANGAGLRLDFKDLNKESLYKAVKEILENPIYKENAKDLSERFRDRPQTPLETAVYWTEYVIRHKGAPHLRSAAVDLAWYQYLLLDVIAFMISVSIAVLVVFYYTFKFVFSFIRKIFSKPKNIKKTKKRKHE